MGALVGVLLIGTGCSSFGKEWKRARSGAAVHADLSGAWDGEWRSDVNGHRGRLRAVATALGQDRYRIRYRASYGRILRFGYSMAMQTRLDPDGSRHFVGEADLGIWGSYRSEGQATPTAFEARYESKFDRGVFRLTRPAARAP